MSKPRIRMYQYKVSHISDYSTNMKNVDQPVIIYTNLVRARNANEAKDFILKRSLGASIFILNAVRYPVRLGRTIPSLTFGKLTHRQRKTLLRAVMPKPKPDSTVSLRPADLKRNSESDLLTVGGFALGKPSSLETQEEVQDSYEGILVGDLCDSVLRTMSEDEKANFVDELKYEAGLTSEEAQKLVNPIKENVIVLTDLEQKFFDSCMNGVNSVSVTATTQSPEEPVSVDSPEEPSGVAPFSFYSALTTITVFGSLLLLILVLLGVSLYGF